MSTPGPSSQHLATLVRLVDDETPEVRSSVMRELEAYHGDVSDWIDDLPAPLDPAERRTLGRLLRPARRRRLAEEWVVPTRGLGGLAEDWEAAESLLRAISDFLHDGVSLRQPLGDALDLLAEEAEPSFSKGGEAALCRFLLENYLKVDRGGDLVPRHYDLAALAEGTPGNSLGLGAILLLIGQRLGAQMRGVNFPGTFYLVIPDAQRGHRTFDPAGGLSPIESDVLARRLMRASPELRSRLRLPFTPGDLVLRIVEDLEAAFAVHEEMEDAELFGRLAESLGPEA
ncbi:transglutaminase family protein [Haloferula sargassicola]|uniref:Protein SirB1 N-terminal domain-containing protein n=1 Tax=Haloferula sargassicola TaxID=490096 RepID=A0ABP9UJM1_9BACT